MRGSGDSEGVLTDEYLPLEQDDAVEVIAWLAAQPWCTGRVGNDGPLLGRLQRAPGRGPPAARAPRDPHVVLDRRPLRGRHPLHGRRAPPRQPPLGLDDVRPQLASTGTRRRGRPRRELWLARLRGSGLWLDTWLRHQRRDAFWKQGSVCEDFSAIQCPVFAVGGWLDAYSNAVPRLMAGLAVPRRGLIGQWAHRYPHMALPGPAVGSFSSLSDGGTRGSRTARRRPTASRLSGSGCRTASARRRSTRPCRAAGSGNAPGRPPASRRSASCSIPRASRRPGPRWR